MIRPAGRFLPWGMIGPADPAPCLDPMGCHSEPCETALWVLGPCETGFIDFGAV